MNTPAALAWLLSCEHTHPVSISGSLQLLPSAENTLEADLCGLHPLYPLGLNWKVTFSTHPPYYQELSPKSLSTDSPCVKIVTALSSTKKDVPRFVSTACLPCTGMLLAPTMQGLSSHSPNSKPEQYLAGRYCSHIPRFVLANRQHIWIGSKRLTFVQHPLITKSLTEVLNRKSLTSLVAQTVKHLPTMWETQVQTLGQEDLLEKEVVTHSSILAWKIPWMEEPGRLQSMGSQRVGHDWATSLSFFHFLTQPFFKWNIYSFIYLF